jgi:DNA-binding NtrC family response regulator
MCRVLVIDDEEAVCLAVKRRLEREGYRVSMAYSAASGMEMIQAADPAFDVIVTDMSLEDADAGLRVLNSAFARDLFAEVIVMTAYGNVGNAVECMRRGAFDYIEKNAPGFDPYEMLAIKIEHAMDRRRQDVRTVQRWERVANAQAKREG